jgi:CubicO group peptidase (beta-lactamase class C family)
VTRVGRRRGAQTAIGVVVVLVVVACAPPVISGEVATGGLGRGPGARASVQGGSCPAPTGAAEFVAASPAQVDLDPQAVRLAIAYATTQASSSVRVYRRHCLVGTSGYDGLTQFTPANLWSATKGVVAMLVGRAIRMGRLGLDDPIGWYLPQADASHARITVRQLLTQTSGLSFHWANDVAAGRKDSVAFTLGLPFDHEPGSYFEYAQTTVTLLGAVVEAATGTDLQEFAQRELFGPLGIPRQRWSWVRDGGGHTHGYAFLAMAPIDLARLGGLLLARGRWGDIQLLDAAFVDEMSAPTPTNPSYGFLVWTNQGEWGYSASSLVRRRRDHRWLVSAPSDAYALSGMFDQLVVVVPSLEMVVVRTGFSGTDNWKHEFFRRLMRAVLDQPMPDPGPAPNISEIDLSDTSKLIDLVGLLQGR